MSVGMVEVGQKPLEYKYKFTVGTLVTNLAQYQNCVRSIQAAGFDDEDCQFLYIDNSAQNNHSAFGGLNHILNHAEGEYIILCHQDVLFDFDGRGKLEKCLSELDGVDPAWAVAGNAGGVAMSRLAMRITDPHGDNQNTKNFPQLVDTLDENFMVLKSSNRMAFSADLNGFHFYGTDICLLADVQGYRSYVIDFHLRHLSAGNKSASFFKNENELTAKYARAFRSRWVRTTCSVIYMSGNPLAVYVQSKFGQSMPVVLL